MRRLGIDFITVLGMPPADYIHLAADVGVDEISLGYNPITPNPYNFEAWSLLDANVRRATREALDARGVRIGLTEGIFITPKTDAKDRAREIDIAAELGARGVNTLSLDPDRARALDQIAALAEMAAAAGLVTTLEFAPIMAIQDLQGAVAAARHVGRADFGIVVDAMHLVRSGGTAAELAALDPNLIGHVQICDASRDFTFESYRHEAGAERKLPGDGEFPLADIIAAVPKDKTLGLEIPSLSSAQAGVSAKQHVERCIAATRKLLEKVDA
jgi:sugar phosphate isomerase/epimerase